MSRSENKNLLTVGYVEQIDLPEWKVYALTAKLDTGALSSALHVENLSRWEDGWEFFSQWHRSRELALWPILF